MGKNRVHTRESLAEAVAESTSVAGVMRFLQYHSINGGTHTHISKLIKKYEIDTSHFLGQGSNKGRRFPAAKKPASHYLVKLPSGSRKVAAQYLRRSMMEVGVLLECAKCGLGSKWEGQLLVLEVDHMNGDPLDNRIENLRFLCPNCHSQAEHSTHAKGVEPELVNGAWRPKKEDPKSSPRTSEPTHPCSDCGSPVWPKATRCKPCAGLAKNDTKIKWPPLKDLEAMVAATSWSATARELGVSDNAIRKRILNQNKQLARIKQNKQEKLNPL